MFGQLRSISRKKREANANARAYTHHAGYVEHVTVMIVRVFGDVCEMGQIVGILARTIYVPDLVLTYCSLGGATCVRVWENGKIDEIVHFALMRASANAANAANLSLWIDELNATI